MNIKVKLFATLRAGRFEISDFKLDEGATVRDVLKLLEIDEKEAAIIFINGVHADMAAMLKSGDELAIFPPIGGG